MITLKDLLAEALGDEPTDRNLWKATKNSASSTDLALNFIERYREVEPDLIPIPIKGPDTLRPAFLVDYSGREVTPYDREFAFIAKSLSYSDQVAVVDEIGSWARADDPGKVLHEKALGGFPDCTNIMWALRRIALYGPLEEAGLLFYVDKPDRASQEDVQSLLNEDSTDELFSLVADRMGYEKRRLNSFHSRGVIASDLAMWLTQFLTVMSHVDKLNHHVDLYLPEWFAGPQLLDWTYRNTMPPGWLSSETLRTTQVVNQLITLPAPSAEALQSLSVKELLDIRSSDQLSSWRENFEDELRLLDADPSLLANIEFRESLTERASQLCNKRSHPNFARVMTEAIQTGLVVAPVAGLVGQDIAGAVAVGTAPILARLGSLFGSWVFGERYGSDGYLVRDRAAETQALRLFLNEPVAGSHPTSQRPPTSFLTTSDGAPLALDIFEDWVEDRYGSN